MGNIRNTYCVIGLMSGTSLDGLDLAGCTFCYNGTGWSYSIEEVKTIPYSSHWLVRLADKYVLTSNAIEQLDLDYGKYLGQAVLEFIRETGFDPDLISSHGHTILHQPENSITFQAGSGKEIQRISGKTVVANFRTLDVLLGGQGAPLVPIGDAYLFSEFDACLNLGGFANISYDNGKERKAFDICPVNIALNYWAKKLHLTFDEGGGIAASGTVNKTLLDSLNSLDYYNVTGPKSLGKEWLDKEFLPIIESLNPAPNDVLRTLCEHIGFQISNSLESNGICQSSILLTGGGTNNSFLVDCIREQSGAQVIIPDQITIDYKEALVFAFLGVLRIRNEINCLCSVTGASKDSSSGDIFVVE